MNFEEIQRTPVPARAPDLECNGHLYWFRERLVSRQRSDLNRELALLAECPVTGQLMYMDGYSPVGWYIIGPKVVQDAYQRERFEEIVLV